MRLPRDAELPAQLIALNRVQFIHGLVVAVLASIIWLPAPSMAQSWLPIITQLVALYLLLQTGLYCGAELARGTCTLVPAAVLLIAAAGVSTFLPLAVAAVLLAVAVLFLFGLERVAAIREHWPVAWQRGRRQHMQFQMVALGSVLFWLFSQDNQALIHRTIQGG